MQEQSRLQRTQCVLHVRILPEQNGTKISIHTANSVWEQEKQ